MIPLSQKQMHAHVVAALTVGAIMLLLDHAKEQKEQKEKKEKKEQKEEKEKRKSKIF